MDELNEDESSEGTGSRNIYDTIDDAIPKEIIRPSDHATIEIVAQNILINQSPHAIGEKYVTEGLTLPAKVTKNLFVHRGKVSLSGMGSEVSETKLEQVPLILVAQQEDGMAWIDTIPILVSAEIAQLDGNTVSFTKFEDFDGSMDLDMVTKIMNREHLEKFSAVRPFELIRSELSRILELDSSAVTILALWIAMTYIHDAFDAFPYIWFNGVKGSGKTTALEFIRETAYHAEMGMRISNPALFRDVDHHRCTICYDEAENLLIGKDNKSVDQDRVSLFNSGYRASGMVRLVEKDGDNYVTRKFRSYSPKALASIRPIDEALQSRCLLINMMVALDPQKSAESLNPMTCAEIRKGLFLLRFAEGVLFYDAARDAEKNRELKNNYDLKNRDWELFKPLLVGAARLCPDRLPDVASFIDGQRLIRQIDNQLSTDATVLLKLQELMVEGENAPNDAKTMVSYKDLMTSLKDDYPELKWMTAKNIGHCLRRMGLGQLTSRFTKGYAIRFDRKLIELQVQRLGLTISKENSGTRNIETYAGGEAHA